MMDKNKKDKVLTKQDIIKMVADRKNLYERDVKDVIYETIDIIVNAMYFTNIVKINGLGMFKPRTLKERIWRHPVTGKDIIIPKKKSYRFELSRGIKKNLNE